MGKGDQVKVPSSLFLGTSPFIWAASEVEALNPRVAYLCRLHGLEMAERLDPTSRGRGVSQFKAALLQRIERDDLKLRTLKPRVRNSDAREMQCFFLPRLQKQVQYEQALRTAGDTISKEDRALLSRKYRTATALFEVLKELVSPTPVVDQELSKAHEDCTRGTVPGLRRRRRGSQEHVVARRAGNHGGGRSKPKQS